MKKNDESEFGFFEEDADESGANMSDEEMEALLEEDDDNGFQEGQLRLTHLALRHQLLERAKAFVSEGVQWKLKPLKQRLAELQVTFRMMSKLTEDE